MCTCCCHRCSLSFYLVSSLLSLIVSLLSLCVFPVFTRNPISANLLSCDQPRDVTMTTTCPSVTESRFPPGSNDRTRKLACCEVGVSSIIRSHITLASVRIPSNQHHHLTVWHLDYRSMIESQGKDFTFWCFVNRRQHISRGCFDGSSNWKIRSWDIVEYAEDISTGTGFLPSRVSQ